MLILNTSSVPKMVKILDNGVQDSINVQGKSKVLAKVGVVVDHNYMVENPEVQCFNDDGTPLKSKEKE